MANPSCPFYNYNILCNSYNMGMRDLPDIYAQARGPQAQRHGHIYQANPECTCYKCYIPLPALYKNLPKLTGNC